MIISVEELKQYISTTESDTVLEAKLQALESQIRAYTNNNFQKRVIRTECPVMTRKLYTTFEYFNVGDTVQVSQSMFNDGLYTVAEKEGKFITLSSMLMDEPEVLVTKVEYPVDVKMGVVNLMKWELENRDKVGIASETISRHSVSYFNMDGDNSTMGFPKALMGFLTPYRKMRF